MRDTSQRPREPIFPNLRGNLLKRFNRTTRRPSPALIVSIISLVMATAGTATAAKVLISSSSQIKNGVVTSADIKDSSVTSKDVKSLSGDKLSASSVGLDKLEGAARAAITDSGTAALEAFRKDGPQAVDPNKVVRVATLAAIPPGTYALFAKTIITADSADNGLLQPGKTTSAHCTFDAGGDKDEGRALLGTPGALAPASINMQITRSYGSAGTASLDCDSQPSKWRATDTSIIAVRVGKAPRNPVEG